MQEPSVIFCAHKAAGSQMNIKDNILFFTSIHFYFTPKLRKNSHPAKQF